MSLWRTPADNGVLLGATTEGLTADEDSALVLKVPRKNGKIAFGGSTGATVEAITVSDAGVCLAVEPYAGGVIEPLPAKLLPLPAVVDEEITPQHVEL